MSTYTVSEKQPPAYSEGFGVAYFERSTNPFHPSNMPEEMKGKNAIVIGSVSPDVEHGWMAIDWAENPIGFIADGTEQKGKPTEYDIEEGYFDDQRLFAYPQTEFATELKERHLIERKKRLEAKPISKVKALWQRLTK